MAFENKQNDKVTERKKDSSEDNGYWPEADQTPIRDDLKSDEEKNSGSK